MKPARKRTRDRILIGLGVVVIGGAAAVGALAGDKERIADTQVHVAVAADGSARIAEAIDYDFGSIGEHHGIFRDVPGLSTDANVQVSSDAPDQFVLLGDRIKIGDPGQTVSGRHRYEISYALAGVAPGGKLGFNGVGAGWDVPITDVTIVVTGPFDWSGLRCDQGSDGSQGGCTATQVEPGRIDVHVDDLDAHEGVSVYADRATSIDVAPELPAFSAPPADDSPKLAPPFVVALVAGLVGAVLAGLWVRRAGAEWVSGASAADAAFPTLLPGSGGTLPPPPGLPAAGAAPVGSARRVDQRELDSMATIEFAPPAGIGAAYGGIVLREDVKPEHKVAWLIEQVSTGRVALDDTTGTNTLSRTGNGPLDPILEEAFAGRSSLSLGSYDAEFSSAWVHLEESFERWRTTSGLWDLTGDRNTSRAVVGGILGGLAGLVLVGVCSAFGLLPGVAAAAAVAGAGLAATTRSWELRVRTPVGSAMWLRIESFRRFLAESEVQHVDWAVEHGVLRQYTAWAVAVGEIDRWGRAVAGSTAAMATDPGATHLAYLAPALMLSAASTSTAPSSSGSGGFGGGGGFGVGGGAGGGGGGSW
ncbi:hypothetical protein BH10ACT1_BH10ACT1_41890 [soil metagenome]